MHAQGGEQDVVGQVGRDRRGGDDVDGAFHARIDQEILAGDLRDGADDFLYVGIHEVERNLSVGLLRMHRHGKAEGQAAGQQQSAHEACDQGNPL